MTEQSSAGRSLITKSGSNLQIEIPTRRNWLEMGFLFFWLLFWVVTEYSALVTLFHYDDIKPGTRLIVIGWIALWTIGGLYALLALLWQLVGKEKVSVTANTLSIGKHVYQLNRTKHYQIRQIRGLQANPLPTDDPIFAMNQRHNIFGFNGGTLQFRYGKKTIKFAGSMSDSEARLVLEALQACAHFDEQHFGSYQLVPGT